MPSNKKIIVDQNKCIGCGLCATIAPETFEIDPNTGKSKIRNNKGDSDRQIQEAIESCPVDAISIAGKKNPK